MFHKFELITISLRCMVAIAILSLTACTTDNPRPTAIHNPTPIPSITATLEEISPTVQQPTLPPTPSIQTGQEKQITHLKMMDSEIGWAVYAQPFTRPDGSQIIRTMDGGLTWQDVTPPATTGISDVRAVFFMDPAKAVIVTQPVPVSQSATTEIVAWKTEDGGQFWVAGEPVSFNLSSPLFYPDELMFVDPGHGWLFGESDAGMRNQRVHFLTTSDGGMHWQGVYDSSEHITDPITLWVGGYYPYPGRFTFLNETSGWFSDGYLFSTQDGGIQWASVALTPPADFPELECEGAGCEYLVSVSAPQFFTDQDGILNLRIYLNTETNLDALVFYPNITNRMSIPVAQVLYLTRDGGQTWTSSRLPVQIGLVYFKDTNTGWLLGKSDPNPTASTQMFQTFDGGLNWTLIAADCLLPLGSQIQFVDETTGFAFFNYADADFYKDFDSRIESLFSGPNLYVTYDAGTTWVKVDPVVIG